MDAAYLLAKNVISARYEDLPPAVVAMTKKQVLDTIGAALAGSSALGIKPLVELATEWAGKPESSIIGCGGRVPAFHAAQVNATMAHALDYDDTHEDGFIHPSAVVVPTAMAMAERQGAVSGRELITAVALGVDLACRLGLATTKLAKPHLLQGGWHFTSLYGIFSAAAVAGRMLGLDEERLINAFGIAYHQAAGNMLGLGDGATTKRMGAGFAARGGITAALMAEKGLTGGKNSLEGEKGLYNLYHAGLDRAQLVSDLGQRFEGINVSFKPYPCCRATNLHIDVALRLVRENDIRPEEVREIAITAHPHAYELVCSPREAKYEPRNIIDCQFSLPWTLACAVTRRKVGLSEFTLSALKDADLRAMAQRVTVTVDSSLRDTHAPALVSIRTESRGTFSKRSGPLLGSPKNPISMDDLVLKFVECASVAVRPMAESDVSRLLDILSKLETLDDVSSIYSRLV